MAKYVCLICGYVYDEALGRPEDGIAPGTPWQSLPEDWVCPTCGATKVEFEKQGEVAVSSSKKPEPVAEVSTDMKELSPLEDIALIDYSVSWASENHDHMLERWSALMEQEAGR